MTWSLDREHGKEREFIARGASSLFECAFWKRHVVGVFTWWIRPRGGLCPFWRTCLGIIRETSDRWGFHAAAGCGSHRPRNENFHCSSVKVIGSVYLKCSRLIESSSWFYYRASMQFIFLFTGREQDVVLEKFCSFLRNVHSIWGTISTKWEDVITKDCSAENTSYFWSELASESDVRALWEIRRFPLKGLYFVISLDSLV